MTPNILIVEDDFELSQIFAEILESVGMATEICRDGQAALDRLTFFTPNVVILDLHIPRLSGAALLDWMRRQERLKGTRIVLISADAQMLPLLEDQADLALIKPVTVDQIIQLTQRLVDS